VSKWRLAVATAVSLAGSLLLGSATPPAALPGETISLVGRPEHGYSPGHPGFQVRTSSAGLLYPGTTRKISVIVINPNPFPIAVRTIQGRLASTSRAGCKPIAANLQVRPYPGRLPLVVRAFSRRDAVPLEVYMPNSVVDACQRARFVIHIDSNAARADR
jgi:hypothetical protein